MTKHCNADAKYIQKFLNTCNGNWHNCIFVDCKYCRFTTRCESPGFLFLPDENAVPCILPLSDAQIIFSRIPEPEECLDAISVFQFLSMYNGYLKSQKTPDGGCPCINLLKNQQDANYEWNNEW